MLGLRDLDWITQFNDVANLSQTAQLIDALKGNIMSKKYLFWNLNPNGSELIVATSISRNADFMSDLATKVPGPRAAMMDTASSTDA